MARNSKIILRDNVRRLLGLKDIESGVGKLVDLGIPNGTAQRVLGGEIVGPALWIFYAFTVDGILSSKYLKNGWREVTGGLPQERSSSPIAEPAAQEARPAPQASAADELRTLAELRDKGILTPSEFETQKAKVLARA